MRAYDEFDNLIFEKEGKAASTEERDAFIKELWANFDDSKVARMELDLIKASAIQAGLKMRKASGNDNRSK